MNASAATIASLGAKHIAMEEDALYLIHKCSVTVFKWASMNEEELKQHIEKLERTRQNTMKVDVAVARAYAKRTGKTTEELLDLMSKELWLTADEAKDYGFVDEIIKSKDKQKAEVVITSSMEERFKEAGIPIPSMLKHEEESFFAKLRNFFTNNNSNMEQNNQEQQQSQEQQQQQQQQQSQEQAQQQSQEQQQPTLESLQAQITALATENATLKSTIEELKKKPVDEPASVINNGGGKGEEEDNDFLSSLAEAQKISNLLG